MDESAEMHNSNSCWSWCT